MFFGNFPRNVFCAFAVTLLARPEKRHVGDHSCFASSSCDEQVVVDRKVVLIGFFGNLHHRFLIKSPCFLLHRPLSSQKTVAFTCAGCTHQQDIKRGPDCYTPGFLPDLARSSPVSHAGSETSKILHSIDPHCTPAPLLPPCGADNPPSLL